MAVRADPDAAPGAERRRVRQPRRHRVLRRDPGRRDGGGLGRRDVLHAVQAAPERHVHRGGLHQHAVRDHGRRRGLRPVSYTHLRAHETRHDLVCRLLLEKKKKKKQNNKKKKKKKNKKEKQKKKKKKK